MLFLAVLVLVVVGEEMQPRERLSQYGGGDDIGGRIVFESGAIQSGVVVAVIVPTAPMAGVGKPGRLVFVHRRGAPTCVGVAHV